MQALQRRQPGRQPRPRGRGPALAWTLALSTVALALVFSSARPAHAQVIQAAGDRYRSPQHFAMELRFGPYKPAIDSEFGGRATPHQNFFGPGNHLMSQIEFDYQFLRHVGSAAIGLGVGYFSQNARNRTLSSSSSEFSADSTTLRLIPLSLSLVYRFDLPWERWKIPLVPYGKVGFDYTIWSIINGNGDVPEDPSGGKGQGGTLGWHGALGLALVLDFLDPVSAVQFDVDMGVNRTSLFVEMGHWAINGLGQSNKLRVGDTTWMAGLLFEF